MNEEHKNIIYTAKDISCYIEGRLSAEQMHAMEKAALDDPFLAEAMEGYETLKEAGWRDQLSELHRRLSGKRKEAKVIPIRQSTGRIWRMIAAAVVIIFGTSITWIKIIHQSLKILNRLKKPLFFPMGRSTRHLMNPPL